MIVDRCGVVRLYFVSISISDLSLSQCVSMRTFERLFIPSYISKMSKNITVPRYLTSHQLSTIDRGFTGGRCSMAWRRV
jgi:hypothetical protein